MTSSDRRTFIKGTAGTAALLALQPELLAEPPPLAAPLRVGLVGAGRQGRAILGELSKFEDVTVAALCDTDARRLASTARRAPEAKPFPAHTEMLDGVKDIDAVFVATPTHLHKAPAIDALSAGKHVYCEGPLASTLEDAQAIVKASRTADKVFQTGHLGRSNPVYKLARSFVRSGAIRDVISMRAQYRNKNSWRTPSSDPAREKALNWKLDPALSLGLIGEFGSHQFDVLHWFLRKYPTSVSAAGTIQAWKDGREEADTVHAELGFEGGVNLAYEATLGNSYEGEYEQIVGTMGAMKLAWTHAWMFKEADAATQGWEVYANRQQFHNDEGITLIADATKLAKQGKLKEGVGLPHPPLYYGVTNFLKSVTESLPIACSAEEGLRAAAVAIQARKAQMNGELLPIDDSLFKVD
ncbi:MAG: Gfo/Idh/MocA family oxidoreductase [bacterium]|nr:Gfo/Idh/MocA family oxidoreductase [bacterium]